MSAEVRDLHQIVLERHNTFTVKPGISLDVQHNWTHRRATCPWNETQNLGLSLNSFILDPLGHGRVIASGILLENRMGETASYGYALFAITSLWCQLVICGTPTSNDIWEFRSQNSPWHLLPRLYDDPVVLVPPCKFKGSKSNLPETSTQCCNTLL